MEIYKLPPWEESVQCLRSTPAFVSERVRMGRVPATCRSQLFQYGVVVVPTPTAFPTVRTPATLDVPVVDVAVNVESDGLDVPMRRVPSKATRAEFEKALLFVPPEDTPRGVPRVRVEIYDVPVVAVRVPTFNIGNVVEPFAASMMKEFAELTVLPPV